MQEIQKMQKMQKMQKGFIALNSYINLIIHLLLLKKNNKQYNKTNIKRKSRKSKISL